MIHSKKICRSWPMTWGVLDLATEVLTIKKSRGAAIPAHHHVVTHSGPNIRHIVTQHCPQRHHQHTSSCNIRMRSFGFCLALDLLEGYTRVHIRTGVLERSVQ